MAGKNITIYPGYKLSGPAWQIIFERKWKILRSKPFSGISYRFKQYDITALPYVGLRESLSVLSGYGGPGTTVIAGNLGLNTALGVPTVAEPLSVYTTDSLKNHDPKTVLTYVRAARFPSTTWTN